MRLSSLGLLLLDLAGDYLDTYSRSYRWLKGWQGGWDDARRLAYLRRNLAGKNWVEEGADGSLAVLPRGREEILKQFPLLEWRSRTWDGKWRIAMYDLPEQLKGRRNKLRQWLKELGFGQWQLSVWISPHPVVEKLRGYLFEAGLDQFCSVYESRRKLGMDDRELAERVWNLGELNEKYRQMHENYRGEARLDLVRDLMKDPFLPRELLPEEWWWDRVMERAMQK